MAREHNLQLVLFAGDNLEIRQRNGSIVSARALIDGDKVYVRADHAEFTSVQLMGHETGHNRIVRGEIDPNAVRRRIRQTFGGIKTVRLAAMYAAAYAGTGMTASEVWEEVICDSLGDMNIFAGTPRESTAWELLKETKTASAETQTESTRGPPAEGKASREVNGGKYEANERTDDSDFAGTEQPAGRLSPRRENTGNSRKVRAGDTYKNLTGKERGRIRKAILSALQTDEEIARFILREINSNKFVEDVYDKIAVHGEKLSLEGVFPDLREAVYAAADMNNQQTYEVNEKTGKAAWTKEHINWLFREYGMGDKKWHQQYAQAYAARMSPDDFLSLTATDRIKGGIELEAVRKYGELDIEKLKEDRTSPMLVVDMETGAVEGHEGRHRMVLLNNEGIDNVPVVIVPYNHGDKYNRTKIGSISLSGQRWTDGAAPGKVEIRDVTPFSTEYRSEVERLFGGDAEIKFSRELAEKGNDILLAKLPADRLLYTEQLLKQAKKNGNLYTQRLLQMQMEKAQRADELQRLIKEAEEVLSEGSVSAAGEESISADSRDKLGEITARGTTKIKQGFSAFSKDDILFERAKRVKPDGKKFDVAMHGTPQSVAFGGRKINMSPRLLAAIIKHNKDYNGQEIRLLSCNTGKKTSDDYCFAEELANALGVTVYAPNDLLIFNDGTFEIGRNNKGFFIAYKPNERRRLK